MHFHHYWSPCSRLNFADMAKCCISNERLVYNLGDRSFRFSHSPIDFSNLHIRNGSQIGVTMEMTLKVNLCYILHAETWYEWQAIIPRSNITTASASQLLDLICIWKWPPVCFFGHLCPFTGKNCSNEKLFSPTYVRTRWVLKN